MQDPTIYTASTKIAKYSILLPLVIRIILFLLSSSICNAIILYSGDNNSNLIPSNSSQEAIFNSVAKISYDNGSGIVGSAVYVKDKYLLTAEHVLNENEIPRRTHVSFDGITFYAIDLEFFPIQISSADLVLFKLIEDPGMPDTSFYSSLNEQNKTGTLIGWGKGRDPSQPDQTDENRNWNWDTSTSTIAKRWGTNRIEATGNQNISGNTYHYLLTRLQSDLDNNEAAFAYYDSGSGIFILNNGTWKLAGITSAVSVADTSTFSSLSTSQGLNFFVRISKYRQTILNSIPDTATYTGWAVDNSLYGTDSTNTADPDNDGINNQDEFNNSTNPNLSDTDGDGLNDGDEINIHGTSPLSSDTDGDGLSDGDEINIYATEPLVADSDSDGLNDLVEVDNGTDPSEIDTDSDGLNDGDEIIIHGTDPLSSDTDGDGLNDGDEIGVYQSNPNLSDSSNDGINDLELVNYGLDPNVNHSLLYNAFINQVRDLRLGSTMIEVNNAQASIALKLEESPDLTNWDETDDLAILEIPVYDNTTFYRFKIQD